ncbi:MAG: sensor histidine kinase [Clostridia bacterium]|nr:sensor histidine kinase [Clostridia bacterium]
MTPSPQIPSTTPGFTYAIAYVMASVMFSSLLPPVASKQRKWGNHLFLFIVLGLFMVATDGVDKVFFIPCMICIVLLLFGHMFITCDIPWMKAAYYTIHAFITGEFSASLAWQLLYYAFGRGLLPSTIPVQAVGGACICFAVTSAEYLLLKRRREEDQRLEIASKDLLIALVIGLSVYTLSNLSYIADSSPFSTRYAAEMFIIRTMTDLGGCGLLLAYHIQLVDLKVRSEKQYMEQMLHMQYEQYELSRESIDLVERKYHDLKHQIQLLRADVSADARFSAEEKLGWLDRMESEIQSFEAQNKTGNKVLDTILTAKSVQAQKQGISLTVVADGQELDFMDPMDLSALFGNALDNAMESVRKMDEADKRLIHLSVSRQKQFIRIHIENCFSGELRYADGRLQTTKQEKQYHGFGLRSISRIAEKYGGSCTTQARDGWFELRILIPVP